MAHTLIFLLKKNVSTMAELIIDYLFSPISQPVQSLISERTYDQDTSYFYVFKRTEYDY